MDRRFTTRSQCRARTATTLRGEGCDWSMSEEAMYVAIVRAWCRLGPAAERRLHPLGPFVLGPEFVWSVAYTPVAAPAVATACAKAASHYPWKPRSGEPEPSVGPPGPGLDPLLSWWLPLGGRGSFGVFYGESAGGVLEFLLVGRQEEGTDDWGLARG